MEFVIYKIQCNCLKNYIGSTDNFEGRIRDHKSCCYNENSKSYNLQLYKHVRECCGWDELNVQVIINRSGSKNKKMKLETYFQKKYDSIDNGLNTYWAYNTLTEAERRLNTSEYGAKHYQENIEKIKQRHNKNYRENKEQIKQRHNKWQIDNETYRKEKFNCECGGKYTRAGKAQHFKTKIHYNYIAK